MAASRHTLVRAVLGAAFLLVAGLGLSGCGADAGGASPTHYRPYTATTPEGATRFTSASFDEIDALPYEPPTGAQRAALRFVAEQERLAMDLFLDLYNEWGDPVLLDLHTAEQTHRDAVVWLLGKYGLPDPAGGLPSGVYDDPELQALSDDLFFIGTERFTGALTAGAILAEASIDELEYQLDVEVDTWDVEFLYDTLLLAERNHLRLFVWRLERYGIVYEPAYLSDAAFERIVNTPLERGY